MTRIYPKGWMSVGGHVINLANVVAITNDSQILTITERFQSQLTQKELIEKIKEALSDD